MPLRLMSTPGLRFRTVAHLRSIWRSTANELVNLWSERVVEDHADLPSASKNPRRNLLTLELSEKQIALLPKLISVISQL